jgi:succinoglycan biosynthesis protein ExoM
VSGGGVKVAVCAATCGRPASLGRLLDSLERLTFGSVQPDPLVIVVDNDPAGSARALVESRKASFRWPLLYEAEPRRNIALARNRAVDVAIRSGAELVAFIDDDEVASPGWLEALLAVRIRDGAPIVAGPVLPVYEAGVPGWVIRGGFFDLPRHPTGTRVRMAFTGNVLIARECLEGPIRRFDPAFGRTGGGDSHFFMRAVRENRPIVWADEAIVEELVPRSRATAGWILRRAYRVGNRTTACERALLPGRLWIFPRVAKALGRIAEGLVLLLPTALAGRAPALGSLRKVAYGFGCLTGLAGVSYAEYDTLPSGA